MEKTKNLINELYQNNSSIMYQQLLRQAKMIEQAEKYQKERNNIMADNEKLHNQVENIKVEYKEKENNILLDAEKQIQKEEK